jgi:hypothetical protein
LVLEVKEGANNVWISKPQCDHNQQWKFDEDGTIRNKLGLVLDLSGESDKPWTPVIVSLKNGKWSQIFRTVIIDELAAQQ